MEESLTNETSLVKWGVRVTTVSWVCQDGGDNVAFSERALAEELCRQCTIEAGERHPGYAVKYEVVEYSDGIDGKEASTMKEPAHVAYDAYAEHTGWKNFQGNQMPKWGELPETIREAWRAAIRAVT